MLLNRSGYFRLVAVDPLSHVGWPEIYPLRPEIYPLRPEIYPVWPDIYPLRPQIYPLRPEICPLRPEICPFRPESAYSVLSQILKYFSFSYSSN